MRVKVLGTQAPYCGYGYNGPGYLVATSNNKKYSFRLWLWKHTYDEVPA